MMGAKRKSGIFFGFLFYLVSFGLVSFGVSFFHLSEVCAKEICVFIHGTALFTSHPKILEFWNQSSVRRAYSGPYLGRGLIPLQKEVLASFIEDPVMDNQYRWAGAYPILGSYHYLHRINQNPLGTVDSTSFGRDPLLPLEGPEYYVFGWSGAFSRAARLREAANLREAIRKIKEPSDSLMIVAHSHGSLALFLSSMSHGDLSQPPLKVNQLVLYGAPLGSETARLAYDSDVFEEVYNFYSDADLHQDRDYITIDSRPMRMRVLSMQNETSRKTFKSFHLPSDLTDGKKVFDVRLMFNGDPQVFDHNQLFSYNRPSRFSDLWPLPVSVFTHSFLLLFEKNDLGESRELALDIRKDPADPSASVKFVLKDDSRMDRSESSAEFPEIVELSSGEFSRMVAAARRNFKGPSDWLAEVGRVIKQTVFWWLRPAYRN